MAELRRPEKTVTASARGAAAGPRLPLPWAHGAGLIARREIADLTSDWRILGPTLLLVIIFPGLLMLMTLEGRSYLALHASGLHLRIAELVPLALMIVGFFPISFSLMIALESFAGEKERNTLEVLLSTPLSDRSLYLGKLLAAVIPPVAASYASMALYLGGVALLIGYQPDLTVLAAIAVLNLAQAVVMVASALIISSHTTSVRAANLLAAFIILPMSVIIQGNNLLILWGGATQLWLIGAALSLFAVLLIRMGLQLFNREQILAREMDDLRPRRFVSLFRQLWRLPPHDALGLRGSAEREAAGHDGTAPFSVRRLYLHDIPSLLRLRWPALGVVVLGLGGAAVLGWVVATHYPIDLNAALTPGGTGRGLLGGVTGGAVDIPAELLVTLVRALLVGGLLILLAVMSFGTLPVLLMMLVAGVGGFVLGEMGAAGASPLALGATLVLPPVLFPAVAFVLLTAFAVRFGLAVAAPPPGFGLGESLLLALVEYLKIGALALPLLLVGGLLQTVLLVVVRAFGY